MKKRKILSATLGTALSALLLVGCTSTPTAPPVTSMPEDSTASATASVQSTGEEVSTPVEESAPVETATTDAGDLGDYHVAIKSARLSEDYEGEPVIIISYDFTNNSANAQMFMVATNSIAYQDGVQLETAIVMDDSYDSQAAMKNIQTGTTLEVYSAFKLDSTTSPIDLEVSELISFDTTKLTKTFDPATL